MKSVEARDFGEEVESLFSDEQIQSRVAELGRAITSDYADRPLVVLCILKGSFMFAADLVRHISLPLRVEFLGLRSYESTESSGVVEITQDLSSPIRGEHVLIVEDIVDTGLTLSYLSEQLKLRSPGSVRVCALLHKPARMKKAVNIDYLGFQVPDVFVVGYGLDCDQRYRNLRYVGRLRAKRT